MRLHEITNIPLDIEEKFGRVMFGDWQYENKIRPTREKDTEYEQKVFKYIQKWFIGENQTNEVQDAILELSQLKDNYPTLLKPDPSSRFPYLYRGIYNYKKYFPNLPEPDYEEIIKYRTRTTRWRNAEVAQRQTVVIDGEGTTMYEPIKLAESWTISWKSAMDLLINFAHKDPEDCVVFKAKVPDDERLFKLHVTLKMFNYPKQYEVIRVSEKPIEAEVFYFRHA